jgi:hypothetical protein
MDQCWNKFLSCVENDIKSQRHSKKILKLMRTTFDAGFTMSEEINKEILIRADDIVTKKQKFIEHIIFEQPILN